MKVWKVFFLGLVYGWCMKWIIDEIFTRDQYSMITNENAVLKERLSLLERARPLETRPIMQAEPQPEPAIQATTTAQPKRMTARSQKDDLKLIKGIGPQMEKKLNNAGVMTFEQMSRLTSTDLQNILGISKRVVQSADNLLTQARQLAQKKTKK
jgi:predicted flap endonuclease-1-like 5' DNA nuclease